MDLLLSDVNMSDMWTPGAYHISPLSVCHISVVMTDICCTYLPNRVVGGVDDDGLRLRVELTGELVRVKKPVGACDRRLPRFLQHHKRNPLTSSSQCSSSCRRYPLYSYRTCVRSRGRCLQGAAVSTRVWPPPSEPSARSNQRKVLLWWPEQRKITQLIDGLFSYYYH